MAVIYPRIVLTIAALLLNVVDFSSTCYSVFLNNNTHHNIVNPIIQQYSKLRSGTYHHQSFAEFKLIIFTVYMMYIHCSSLVEFKLLIYNSTMMLLILNNVYIIYCLKYW